MAFFLIECPPDVSQEMFIRINESIRRSLSSPHNYFLYAGTAGDYGLKVSVILNDNESLASLYNNVGEFVIKDDDAAERMLDAMEHPADTSSRDTTEFKNMVERGKELLKRYAQHG